MRAHLSSNKGEGGLNMSFEKRTIKSADGFEFSAWFLPAEGSKKGNLVLVQEIFGVNTFMKQAMARFAAEGFDVLAPSMFDRQEKDFTTDGHGEADIAKGGGYARANGLEPAMIDIAACVGSLGGAACITGFCYGGSMAYFAACNVPGIQAASCYYGSLLSAAKDLPPKAPTIAHFGRLDLHIPMEGVAEFVGAREDVPVYVYDEAGHGFARQGTEDLHAESDALAFQRTLDLFDKAIAG